MLLGRLEIHWRGRHRHAHLRPNDQPCTDWGSLAWVFRLWGFRECWSNLVSDPELDDQLVVFSQSFDRYVKKSKRFPEFLRPYVFVWWLSWLGHNQSLGFTSFYSLHFQRFNVACACCSQLSWKNGKKFLMIMAIHYLYVMPLFTWIFNSSTLEWHDNLAY